MEKPRKYPSKQLNHIANVLFPWRRTLRSEKLQLVSQAEAWDHTSALIYGIRERTEPFHIPFELRRC